jgi:uncharacterized protein (TIGR03437 family)
MRSRCRLFAVGGLISAISVSGQTPTISRVVDAASLSTQLAPGSLANVIGSNFGTSTSIAVTAGGKPCAVLNASASQLQIQFPVDASLGPGTLQVGTSAPFGISLQKYAPALYSADGSGQGNVAAYDASGALVTASNPMSPGDAMIVYANGLGPTNPVVPTGSVSPSSPIAGTTAAPTVTVAGMPATILFSGLTPGSVGRYQINFIFPDITPLSGDQPILVSIGGATSSSLIVPATNRPVIGQLQNNYSFMQPGLPGYGIAQGSIFIIRGRNLAKATTPVQDSYPLPASLEGVSLSVTVNGTTTHPILYYVTPRQIGAILPSATPVGAGQITVTSNGETSPSAPIQVVRSAFGILTLSGSGAGRAAAFDAANRYLSVPNSVNPGEILNLWGSGIGSAAGDESVAQTPVDLTNIPVEVIIGGISAAVRYRGRSIYPGLDQIQAVVPAGVAPGCWVSVVVRTGGISSNFATIPVAASGRACSEPALGLTADMLRKPSISFGSISLQKNVGSANLGSPNDPASTKDIATAQFSRLMTEQPVNDLYASPGSCIVRAEILPPWLGPFQSTSLLDAGLAVRVSGPNGSTTIPLDETGGDFFYISAPILIPAAGGTFSVENGNGGGDVKAFAATASLGAPPVWSNRPANNGVMNRSDGVNITWTGGSANGYVRISGASNAANGPASFVCTAPASANQFTVPSWVLQALPATGPAPNYNGLVSYLSVAGVTNAQAFSASGLDAGNITYTVTYTSPVTYQ